MLDMEKEIEKAQAQLNGTASKEGKKSKYKLSQDQAVNINKLDLNNFRGANLKASDLDSIKNLK